MGMAQPVTQFIDTALKYQQVQDQSKFREQEIANLKQRERLFQQEADERDRQKQLRIAPKNIRQSPITMALPEDKREEFVQQMISGKYADPDGTTNTERGEQFLAEHNAGVNYWFSSMKEKAKGMIEQTMAAHDNAILDGNPIKIKAAQNKMNNAFAYLSSIDGKHSEARKLLEGPEGKYKAGEQVSKVQDPSGSGALGVATFGGTDPEGKNVWENWTPDRGAESGNQEVAADLAKRGVLIKSGPATAKLSKDATPEMVREATRMDNYIALQAMGTPTYLGTTTGGGAMVGQRGPGGGDITQKPLPGGEMPGPKTQQRMSEPVLKALSKFKTTHQDIQEAREKFNAAWVGPVSGRGRDIAQAVRNDPQFEAFRRTVGRMVTVAYGLSGQQISDREMERLHKVLLPSVTQMDENLLATLDELDGWIVRNTNNELDYNKMSDYIVKDEMYLKRIKESWGGGGGKDKYLGVSTKNGKPIYERPDGSRYYGEK
jgi:hypothetical protein